MTITDDFSSWADAEMIEGAVGGRNLSRGLQVDDLKCPGFIYTPKRHRQFIRVQDRMNYHEPLANFDHHWAQVQFALALLLWVTAAVIVEWIVS